MKRTSRASSPVIAAMSPLRSSAGPAIVRSPTPSSSRDDCRQRRLAQPGRADEEDVVERVAACPRSVEGDLELLLRALLADEVVEAARAQGALDPRLPLPEDGSEELGARHAALRSASRTRSSAGSSGSTRASACSASVTVGP